MRIARSLCPNGNVNLPNRSLLIGTKDCAFYLSPAHGWKCNLVKRTSEMPHSLMCGPREVLKLAYLRPFLPPDRVCCIIFHNNNNNWWRGEWTPHRSSNAKWITRSIWLGSKTFRPYVFSSSSGLFCLCILAFLLFAWHPKWQLLRNPFTVRHTRTYRASGNFHRQKHFNAYSMFF